MFSPPDDCIDAELYANRDNPIETDDAKERKIPGRDNCKSQVLEIARVSRIQSINESLTRDGIKVILPEYHEDDNILTDGANLIHLVTEVSSHLPTSNFSLK